MNRKLTKEERPTTKKGVISVAIRKKVKTLTRLAKILKNILLGQQASGLKHILASWTFKCLNANETI